MFERRSPGEVYQTARDRLRDLKTEIRRLIEVSSKEDRERDALDLIEMVHDLFEELDQFHYGRKYWLKPGLCARVNQRRWKWTRRRERAKKNGVLRLN